MIANSCVLSEPHKQQGYGRIRGSEQTQVIGSVELLGGLLKLIQSLCDLSHLSTGDSVSYYVPSVHISQLCMSL